MLPDVELQKTAEEFRAYPKSVQPGIPTLGAIPTGWNKLLMGDLLTVIQRPVKMIDEELYQLVTAKRSRGGIVAREHLKGSKIATKTQFVVKTGDFVMSRRQIAHGACGILPAALNESLVSNEYAALLPTKCLDNGFLRHLPHSIYFQQTCFHSSIGVHVEKLVFNMDHWLTWPFLVPPIPEQRRIAAVLDTWDAAVATADRLVEAQRHRFAWLQGQLLTGEKRLHRSSNPWPAARLSDYFVPRRQPGEPGLPLLSVTMNDGIVERRKLDRRSESAIVEAAHLLVVPGDIAYNMMRMWQGASGLCHVRGNISPAYVVMTPKNNVDPQFAAHWLKSKNTIDLLWAHSHGLTEDRLRLYPDDFLNISTRFPSLVEQRQISSALDNGLKDLTCAERLANALRSQKRGLMQRLLIGKLRVPASIDALTPSMPSLEPVT